MRTIVTVGSIFTASLFAFGGCGSAGTSTPALLPDAASVADAPATSCTVAGRTGVTTCRYDCSAGQYCDDTQTIRTCVAGCLSDNNCAGNERCEKCNGTVGSCVACARTAADVCNAPSKSDGGIVPPADQCKQDNLWAKYCPKGDELAFNCPNNASPEDSSCYQPNKTDPNAPFWVWCCPR